MLNPGNSLPLPESESKPPQDNTRGWKLWGPSGIERWWTGRQWTDTYKKKEEE